MRWVVVMLAACGGGTNLPEAGVCEIPANLCGGPKCGNGAIDGCFLQPDPAVCAFIPANEVCDGAFVTRTCTQLGYFGGVAQCGPGCTIDEGTCDVCPPGTACRTLAGTTASHVVPSGDRVLVADATMAWILDGTLHEVAALPLVVEIATGVPGGWLVARGGLLQFVSEAGEVSASVAAPPDLDRLVTGSASVLAISARTAGTATTLSTRIVAFDGHALGPATELGTFSGVGYAATWSGARYFIAAYATLHRLDASGVVVGTSSLPAIKETAWLFWEGGVGWWVGARPHMFQRFNAAGTFFGSRETFAPSVLFDDYAASGNHLLALRTRDEQVELVPIDTNGDLGSPRRIGLADPARAGKLADLGDDLVIAWPRTRLRVARVGAF